MASALEKLDNTDEVELSYELRLFLERMRRETIAEARRLMRQVETIERLLGRGHFEGTKNNLELTNEENACIIEDVTAHVSPQASG